MSEKVVTFRIDENMKKAFEAIAKENDLTTSQMLRHYMRNTVEQNMKKNAQKSLLTGLEKKGRANNGRKN